MRNLLIYLDKPDNVKITKYLALLFDFFNIGVSLNDLGKRGVRAEIPRIAQVFRRRVFGQLVIEEREYWQPMVDPPRDRIANRRRAHAAYPQPIRTTVSEVKV